MPAENVPGQSHRGAACLKGPSNFPHPASRRRKGTLLHLSGNPLPVYQQLRRAGRVSAGIYPSWGGDVVRCPLENSSPIKSPGRTMTFVWSYLPSGWSLGRRGGEQGCTAPFGGEERDAGKTARGRHSVHTYRGLARPRPFTGSISFTARGSETETRAQDHNGPRWWSCRARARAGRLDAAASPRTLGRTRLLGPGPSRNRRRGHSRALRPGSDSGPASRPSQPSPGARASPSGRVLAPPLPGGSSGGPADSAQTEPRRAGRGPARPAARGQQFRPPLPRPAPPRPAPGKRSRVGSRGPGRAALGSPEGTRRERAAEPRRGMTALGVQVGGGGRGGARPGSGVKPPRARAPRGPAGTEAPKRLGRSVVLLFGVRSVHPLGAPEGSLLLKGGASGAEDGRNPLENEARLVTRGSISGEARTFLGGGSKTISPPETDFGGRARGWTRWGTRKPQDRL